MSVARLCGVEKEYLTRAGPVRALRGVDLQVGPGELLAVVGPSGSGKSTLLHILGCLDAPTAGNYQLGGREVSGLRPRELSDLRAREIGFVFQGFNLVGVLDALENVELAMLCAGARASERRRRAIHLMEAVGLGGVLHHRPDQLSGGQRQRVALARALANRPRLVLADEPTASLDSQSATQVLELLADLNRGEGVSIVLSTHDSRALAYARRTVEMRDGLVLEASCAGTPVPLRLESVRSRGAA